MPTYLKLRLALPVSLSALCWCSAIGVAAERLVVDAPNLTLKPLYSATVYGFRKFPVSKIIAHEIKDGFEINADVLSDSLAVALPGRSFTWRDFSQEASSVVTASDYTPIFVNADFQEQTTLRSQKLHIPSSGEYDATFVASAFRTELVDFNQIEPDLHIESLDTIQLNSAVAMDFLSVYDGLNALSDYEPAKIPESFYRFDNALAQHSELYAVAKLPIGKITMGTPVSFDPTRYGVDIPPEWSEVYKVKLFLFGMTIHDHLQGVREVDVTIKFPSEYIAIDLLPLTYTEASMAAHDTDGGILIKTVLGGEIFYETRLRPAIKAYGLQSNEFGWQLDGGALETGSLRVLALVRGPRNIKELDMESAFTLRGPDSWITEGSVGSSEPEIHAIVF